MNPPPYHPFPILNTEEIILREVLKSDLEAILDVLYYDGVKAASIEHAIEIQKQIDRDYLAGSSVHWAIAEKSSNSIVGTCGFYRGFENEIGEVGCVLLSGYHGRGIMTNALEMVIQFGFDEMDLKKIEAITSPENEKAIALLERLEFSKGSRLSHDQIVYGKLPYADT